MTRTSTGCSRACPSTPASSPPRGGPSVLIAAERAGPAEAAWREARALARALSDAGALVRLLAAGAAAPAGGWLDRVEEGLAMRLIAGGAGRSPSGAGTVAAALLDEIRPDVVHVVGDRGLAASLMRAARRRRIPYVVTLVEAEPGPAVRLDALIDLLRRLRLNRAARVIAGSAAAHRRCVRWGVRPRLVVTHPALDAGGVGGGGPWERTRRLRRLYDEVRRDVV